MIYVRLSPISYFCAVPKQQVYKRKASGGGGVFTTARKAML